MNKVYRALALLLCVAMAFALAACSGKPSEEKEYSTVSEDGIEKPANSGESMELNILNWGDYIDEDILSEFQEEYPNIKISYNTFDSNEAMLVQVSQDSSVYDICFPSDYTIEKMISKDLLQPLNKDLLPHLGNIDERFMDLSFDPDNLYSVPYMWGTVGIIYNTTMVDDPVDSWDILWNEKYAGQISMYDSARDSLMVALERLGYSMNTTNADELAQAEASLIEQKPLVLNYATDNMRDQLIGNSLAMGVMYSGDAILAVDENPDLAYSIPKEGSNIWFDNVVLLKRSKNVEAAHLFIDYLMRSDVALRNAEYIGYCTPNKAAFEKSDSEMQENPIWNPTDEEISNCESFSYLGEKMEVAYNDAWTRIKLSK